MNDYNCAVLLVLRAGGVLSFNQTSSHALFVAGKEEYAILIHFILHGKKNDKKYPCQSERAYIILYRFYCNSNLLRPDHRPEQPTSRRSVWDAPLTLVHFHFANCTSGCIMVSGSVVLADSSSKTHKVIPWCKFIHFIFIHRDLHYMFSICLTQTARKETPLRGCGVCGVWVYVATTAVKELVVRGCWKEVHGAVRNPHGNSILARAAMDVKYMNIFTSTPENEYG